MKYYKPKGRRFEEASYHCHAKAKWSGKRCSRMALRGQRVCYYHGGAAPQNLEAARKRIANPMALLAYEIPLLEWEGESDYLMDEGTSE